jgi:hypothetical protein
MFEYILFQPLSVSMIVDMPLGLPGAEVLIRAPRGRDKSGPYGVPSPFVISGVFG